MRKKILWALVLFITMPLSAIAEPNAGPCPIYELRQFTVYFASGSDGLTTDAQTVIRELANFRAGLEATPPQPCWPGRMTGVVVTGHADSTGRADDNNQLSRLRAERVADALMRAGVPRDLITVQWKGDTAPAFDSHRGADPLDRRVTMEPSFIDPSA